jgi:hypothetical protein
LIKDAAPGGAASFFVSITKRKVNETDNTVGKPYFFVFLQQNV